MYAFADIYTNVLSQSTVDMLKTVREVEKLLIHISVLPTINAYLLCHNKLLQYMC